MPDGSADRIQSERVALNSRSVILAATSASTVAIIPVFLLGAMGLFVRSDLHFGQTQLGLAVSAFWLMMAVGGVTGGRVSQNLGATTAIRIGVIFSILVLLGVALTPSWVILVGLMGFAGLASALTQPAADLAILSGVPTPRLGVAFGVKQTALPGAALVAGIGIPVLANTVGWRWAFAVGAIVGLPALLGMPHLVRQPVHKTVDGLPSKQRLEGIVGFSAAFGLAMIAVSATGAFYVESAIAGGTNANSAGLYLAAGSACGIAGRFLFAWKLGAVREPLLATSVIMAVGGISLLCLAFIGSGWALFVVTLVAIGAGWGWNGLLTFAVVSSYPIAPARASGYIVLGAASGGILGPVAFGVLVQHCGFRIGWIAVSACFFSAAALLVAIARHPIPNPA